MHPFTIKTRFRFWTITTQMINIQTQKAPLSFSQKSFSSFRIRDHATLIQPMETFTKHTYDSVWPSCRPRVQKFLATCEDEPVNKSSKILLLQSVDGDSWFSTTHVSLDPSGTLVRLLGFFRILGPVFSHFQNPFANLIRYRSKTFVSHVNRHPPFLLTLLER